VHWNPNDRDPIKSLFDWNSAAEATEKFLSGLVDRALQRLHLEGAVVDQLQIQQVHPDRRPLFYIYVTGARRTGSVTADLRGNINDVNLDD
jgi:hypothetical protein